MRWKKNILALASGLIVGWASAGVKCSAGATCIDSAGWIAAGDNTDFTGNISVVDESFTIKDTAAPTKILNFETSSITAGQTRVWTAPDRSDTLAGLGAQTFTGLQSFGGQAQFTGTSRGFSTGGLRLEDDGVDNYVILQVTTDVSATRTWNLNWGDAGRTLTMTGDASLNQNVLTTSTPTFAGTVLSAVLFAALGTPANGTMYYCSDCGSAAGACVAAGGGKLAIRLAGAWSCAP